MAEYDEEPATLEEASRWELVCLWSDLDSAIDRGINTNWSMECDWLLDRIKMFTQFVGPTSWETVPITILESGVFQRLLGEMGHTVEVDMEKVAEIRREINAPLERYMAHPPKPEER